MSKFADDLIESLAEAVAMAQGTEHPAPTASIPCPFVYANGRSCTGHVIRIEAYKADLSWNIDAEGRAAFDFQTRSHYHLFCSEKGNHAGIRRQDPATMKFWFDQLPERVQKIIERSCVVTP